jgi:hypothetical protein
MTAQTLDQAEVEAFAGRLMELYTGGMLTYLVDIGHRTGLFAALAEGPATSAELAARADLQERYVREWLAAMATGGIVDYEPGSGSFRLPAERAACLTGRGAANLAPLSRLDTHLAKHVDAVARAFREGGGVPYAEFRPELTDVIDALGRASSTSCWSTPTCRWSRGWPSGWRPAPGWPTSAAAPATPWCCWPAPSRPRRSSATTLPRTRSPGPGRRRPGWPTSASRSATWPGSRSSGPTRWCSCSTPSTTRWTRRPCWPGSTRPWCPAAPWSWSSPGPPATWRTTWATRWWRSSTGSARCTA